MILRLLKKNTYLLICDTFFMMEWIAFVRNNVSSKWELLCETFCHWYFIILLVITWESFTFAIVLWKFAGWMHRQRIIIIIFYFNNGVDRKRSILWTINMISSPSISKFESLIRIECDQLLVSIFYKYFISENTLLSFIKHPKFYNMWIFWNSVLLYFFRFLLVCNFIRVNSAKSSFWLLFIWAYYLFGAFCFLLLSQIILLILIIWID